MTDLGPLCCTFKTFYRHQKPSTNLAQSKCIHCGLPKHDAIHSDRMKRAVKSYLALQKKCAALERKLVKALGHRIDLLPEPKGYVHRTYHESQVAEDALRIGQKRWEKLYGLLEKKYLEVLSQKNGWEESAAQFARNTDFYRGLVVRIGEMLGDEARTADDGSVYEDVLCIKVPELVEKALGMKRGRADEG
jgi:hypothetical protein